VLSELKGDKSMQATALVWTDPAPETTPTSRAADHGFVFSKDQVERCSQRMMRQNEARFVAAARFDIPPQLSQSRADHAS
jgi:hypothetical protein